MADQGGGFDCEFVEKPSKGVQSECPVCLLVLKEPYQVTCCGYGFCRVCIERVRAENKPCPCCNAIEFDCFEDKGRKRSLYDFKVRCTNKKLGCQWVGELGEVETHLNYKPPQDKQLEGCQFTKVQCLHCSAPFLRSNVKVHQNDQCFKRPFSCEYCKDHDSTYEDVTTNHWPVCASYPVQCPNKCSEKTMERQNLEGHIANDCLLTVIDCDFKGVGCEVRLPRKDLPTHLTEALIAHVSLQTKRLMVLEKKNGQLEQQVRRFEKEKKELEKQVEKLTTDTRVNAYQIGTPLCPLEFTMPEFEKHKKNGSKDMWYSPPFYTHPKGYKMCVRVIAGGCSVAANTHVSVYLYLMRGEYDEKLKWPFRGTFTIQLLSQEGDEGHHSKTVDYDDDTPGRASNRVTDRERVEGWGCSYFIPHNEVTPNYLQHDCLKFRVKKVE